jgi:hypothetical protein
VVATGSGDVSCPVAAETVVCGGRSVRVIVEKAAKK